jgi:hypothetical protein
LYQRESIEQKEEISILRNIIHRLNIELSAYQAKFPSPMLQSSLKVNFTVINFFILLDTSICFL